MLGLANNTELVADQMDVANEEFDENTALTKEAAERFKTFDSQLGIAKNTLTDAGITIGTALLPKLTELAKKFAALVKENGPAIQAFADQLPGAFDKAARLRREDRRGIPSSRASSSPPTSARRRSASSSMPEVQTRSSPWLRPQQAHRRSRDIPWQGIFGARHQVLIKGVPGTTAGSGPVGAGAAGGLPGVGAGRGRGVTGATLTTAAVALIGSAIMTGLQAAGSGLTKGRDRRSRIRRQGAAAGRDQRLGVVLRGPGRPPVPGRSAATSGRPSRSPSDAYEADQAARVAAAKRARGCDAGRTSPTSASSDHGHVRRRGRGGSGAAGPCHRARRPNAKRGPASRKATEEFKRLASGDTRAEQAADHRASEASRAGGRQAAIIGSGDSHNEQAAINAAKAEAARTTPAARQSAFAIRDKDLSVDVVVNNSISNTISVRETIKTQTTFKKFYMTAS